MNNSNPNIIEDEKKDVDYDETPGFDKNSINSHYRIINKEFMNLKNSMKNLQNKIKLESYLSDLRQKKQHNERLLHLQQLSKRKKVCMISIFAILRFFICDPLCMFISSEKRKNI